MMNSKRLAAIALAFFGLAGLSYAAESQKGQGSGADQTENDYYWKGTQLYNLGRLGEAFESFEKAIQRKQNSKEAEAYLLQIRQEIVTNAKKRSEERGSLNYTGNAPDTALNVTYLQKGYIRVILQAKFLFDENTASLKSGAMDILNRLGDIVQTNDQGRVEITVIDDIDATTNAKDIDAERALMVFSMVNFKRFATPAN